MTPTTSNRIHFIFAMLMAVLCLGTLELKGQDDSRLYVGGMFGYGGINTISEDLNGRLGNYVSFGATATYSLSRFDLNLDVGLEHRQMLAKYNDVKWEYSGSVYSDWCNGISINASGDWRWSKRFHAGIGLNYSYNGDLNQGGSYRGASSMSGDGIRLLDRTINTGPASFAASINVGASLLRSEHGLLKVDLKATCFFWNIVRGEVIYITDTNDVPDFPWDAFEKYKDVSPTEDKPHIDHVHLSRFGVQLQLRYLFGLGSGEKERKTPPVFTRSAIFLELGGSAGLGSLNYEHAIINSKPRNSRHVLLGRAGVLWIPDLPSGFGATNFLITPLSISYLVGGDAVYFQGGLACAPFAYFWRSTEVQGKTELVLRYLVGPVVGFRYYPKNERIFMSLTINPFKQYHSDFTDTGEGLGNSSIFPWGGLGIGVKL